MVDLIEPTPRIGDDARLKWKPSQGWRLPIESVNQTHDVASKDSIWQSNSALLFQPAWVVEGIVCGRAVRQLDRVSFHATLMPRDTSSH